MKRGRLMEIYPVRWTFTFILIAGNVEIQVPIIIGGFFTFYGPRDNGDVIGRVYYVCPINFPEKIKINNVLNVSKI